jgi:hypothetical protein
MILKWIFKNAENVGWTLWLKKETKRKREGNVRYIKRRRIAERHLLPSREGFR